MWQNSELKKSVAVLSRLVLHTPGLGLLFDDWGYCASIGYCFWNCPGQELWYVGCSWLKGIISCWQIGLFPCAARDGSTTESCESVIKSRRGIPEFVRFKFACTSGMCRYLCVWFRCISLCSKLFSRILDGPNLSRRSLGQEVDSSDWACEPSWSERERIRWAVSELWQWVIKEKPPAWYWDILSKPYSSHRLIFCFLGTLVNTPRQKSFWQHKRRNI